MQAFIWYSTDLFDLGRDVSRDHVFIDLSSQKLIVSSHISGRSAYNTAGEGSALSSNQTWLGRKRMSYTVTAAEVERGIRDGLARFPAHLAGLPTKAAAYSVTGFNVQLEATPGAAAGLNLRRLNITAVPPGAGL